MKWKRGIFSAFVCLIVISCLHFSSHIQWTLLRFYASLMIKDRVGGDFLYESFTIDEKGNLSIEGLKIKAESLEKEENFLFFAKKADIKAKVTLFPLSLQGEITLENPTLSLMSLEPLKKLSKLFLMQSSFMKIKTPLYIEKGMLIIEDPLGGSVYFTVDGNINEEEPSNSQLIIKNLIKPEAFSLSCQGINGEEKTFFFNCQDIDIAPLFNAIAPSLEGLSAIKMLQGRIEGAFTLKENKSGIQEVKGSLTLKEAFLESVEKGFYAHIPLCSLESDFHKKVQRIVVGRGTLKEEAELTFLPRGKKPYIIILKEGGLSFETAKALHYHFVGKSSHQGTEMPFEGEGCLNFFHAGKETCSLEMGFSYHQDRQAKADISIKELGNSWRGISISFKNISKAEMAFFKDAFDGVPFPFPHIHFHEGILDGEVKTYVFQENIKDISIDHLAFRKSTLELPDFHLLFKAEEAIVKGSLNFSAKEPMDCMNVQVDMKGAYMQGSNPFPYTIEKCNAVATLENGIVKKVAASGIFQGIESKVDFDASSNNEAFIKLNCPSKSLVECIPSKFKKALERNFKDSFISIEAALKKGDVLYDVRGKLGISTKDQKMAQGKFGFKIPREGTYVTNTISQEDIEKSSMDPVFQELFLKEYSSLQGSFPLQEGWLFFENVDLNSCIAPLIFLDEWGERYPLELRGTATLVGKFGCEGVMLSYDAKDIVLESDDFVINVERIYQKEFFNKRLTPACLFYSGDQKTILGSIPINHGTYKDKSSSLTFHDVACNVILQSEKIHIHGIEAFSSGLYFQGTIDVDCSLQGKGSFDIDIHTDEISGKAADLRDFVSHLDSESYISYIPLDGEIRSGKGGCHFTFKVREEVTEVFTKIKGCLFEGSIPLDTKNVTLRELCFNFCYESGGRLEISGIQGTLIGGGFKKPKEYFLNSEGIIIESLSSGEGRFNIWMEGEREELFRFEGYFCGNNLKENFSIDIIPNIQKSHCFGIHPKEFQLSLDSRGKVNNFFLKLAIDLSKTSPWLQESFLKLSSLWTLEKKEAENVLWGVLHGSLHYVKETEALSFHALFDKFQVGEKVFKEAEIEGLYAHRTFFLNQFHFDDLSFAAEIARENQLWKIRFLGGGIKDKLTLGAEGIFDETHQQIALKIRRLEVHPDLFHLFPVAKRFDPNRFQGSINGQGDFIFIKGEDNDFELGLEVLLEGKIAIDQKHELEMKPFVLSYKKSEGFLLKNFEAHLALENEKGKSSVIKLGKEASISIQGKMNLNNVTFSLWPSAIKPLLDFFAPSFPLLSEEHFQGLFTRGNEVFQGIFSLVTNADGDAYFLSLNEGKIAFLESSHLFRNFSLEIRKDLFRMFADFSCGSKWIRMSALSKECMKNKGIIELYDPLEEGEENNKITLLFEREEEFSFNILKAEGSLAGISLDLEKEKGERELCSLKGQVSINTVKTAPYNEGGVLFNEEIFSMIGGNFHFDGLFQFFKKGTSHWSAKGKLNVSSAIIKDFLIDHIITDFVSDGEKLVFENVQISDPAGSALIPKMHVSMHDSITEIPSLQATLRPANIRTMDGLPLIKNKALKINDFRIKDLFFSWKESPHCQASGWLKFSNTSKSFLQNTLFQIPREIITRLGLNPSVLTPVKGEIFFECAGKKVFITKLKDVYSEGKGSKFYLASKAPSYIDFNGGRLKVQIRMKQYNILLKLAELFTVSVEGTYKKLLYSLQKQE